MIDHTPVLMAFAKGQRAEPPFEGLMSALQAGLCTRTTRIRLCADGEGVRVTWRLTELGQRVLQRHVDSLPPQARPMAIKQRRRRPMARTRNPWLPT